MSLLQLRTKAHAQVLEIFGGQLRQYRDVDRVDRLAAILAADVAGYSRSIGADEEGTLGRLKRLRAEVIDPKLARHHGRIVKTTGDSLLVEFASVVEALRCRGADRNRRKQCPAAA